MKKGLLWVGIVDCGGRGLAGQRVAGWIWWDRMQIVGRDGGWWI